MIVVHWPILLPMLALSLMIIENRAAGKWFYEYFD